METQNDPTSAINNDQSKSMKGDIASNNNVTLTEQIHQFITYLLKISSITSPLM